jgi:hypothetical protein
LGLPTANSVEWKTAAVERLSMIVFRIVKIHSGTLVLSFLLSAIFWQRMMISRVVSKISSRFFVAFFACATLQRDDDIVELAAGVRCICEPVGEEPCTSLVVFGRFRDV